MSTMVHSMEFGGICISFGVAYLLPTLLAFATWVMAR